MSDQNSENDLMLQANLDRITNKIVVMSGKGGVGKSTVSVNLAYGLTLQGFKVGLLDVDLHGPSIAKMTGIEGKRLSEDGGGQVTPIEAAHNLFVVTVASMLENSDDPIVWRGPIKISAIKQFLSEIFWPKLDYLIVDCPPGTGDEPLTVMQLINDVTGTVIVSTPQDVSLIDVRKSMRFCEKLSVPILGVVENMSGFVCPNCSERVDIFKKGGVSKMMGDFKFDILGNIPLDPKIVDSGDDGRPYIYHYSNTEGGKEFQSIISKLIDKVGQQNSKKSESKKHFTESDSSERVTLPEGVERIAIAVENDLVAEHPGHAPKFVMYDIKDKNILKVEELTPPPHEHGVIPRWLKSLSATTIIAGNIGKVAKDMFKEFGIKAISGAPALSHNHVLDLYINDKLESTNKECDHSHSGGHGCH